MLALVQAYIMSLTERALTIGHRVFVTGLITLTVGGITFCGVGMYDLVMQARMHKALKQERLKAEAAAAGSS